MVMVLERLRASPILEAAPPDKKKQPARLFEALEAGEEATEVTHPLALSPTRSSSPLSSWSASTSSAGASSSTSSSFFQENRGAPQRLDTTSSQSSAFHSAPTVQATGATEGYRYQSELSSSSHTAATSAPLSYQPVTGQGKATSVFARQEAKQRADSERRSGYQ